MDTVSFIRMDEGTPEEYEFLHKGEVEFTKSLPSRIIQALKDLDNTLSGYKISRFQHSLQSATRAEEDGADIELIMGALIHDLGDDLAPANHSQLASTIIRPYVREEVTWIVSMHGLMQMYYFGPKDYDGKDIGIDKDLRANYLNHKWFNSCDKFCRDWDQMSFDPNYPTKSIDHFKPMIQQIFTRDPFDPKYVGNPQFS
jgi:predicted HD phosphohydrolase